MSVIIRLQGLPLTASSGDIRNFFSGLRIPDGAVNIVGGDDGDAFIGFATDEDARQAMRKNEGLIHNTEVRLFLSSRTEMNEVIDNARSAPPPPPKPPSIPLRFGTAIHSPRNEREEPQIFSSREDQSRFGRDAPSQYGRNGPSFGRDEPQRYGRESSQTSSFTPRATFPTGTMQSFGDTRFDERKGTGQYPKDRPSFDNIVQGPNYGSEKIDQRKSEQDEMRAEPWINRDRDFLGNIRHQSDDRGYMHPFSAIRQDDGDGRNPTQDVFGNSRIDGDARRDVKNKEESWRGENSLAFQRSNSPRSKKPRGDRICVHISNLPFRVKESEIRRLLGSGLNPYAIKKIFNEDNAPSDVWIMEFSSEAEAMETVRRRMEVGGRQARLKIIDEPEADRLLRQKFKSPPRREKVGEQRDSFDEKVRMQQEAIEMEKARMNGSNDLSSAETALAGAFSGPVFSTNRGFMRGGRGGGRGMRGEMRGINNGGTRGRRGGLMNVMGRGDGLDRNCLLISNMPHLGSPQVLLEHLRIMPSQFVRVDQIAPDAAIIELREEMYAVGVAENASGESFPFLFSKKVIVAAMSRRQIEDEFNLRGGEINHTKVKQGGSHPGIDPEMIRSIGGEGCVLICHGFPRDLTIDEVKSFFEGYPMIESSVRMRMEGGEGTGECMVAMSDVHSSRKAVQTLNGTLFRGAHIVVQSL